MIHESLLFESFKKMIRINFLSWFLQKLGNIIESQINDSDLRQALYTMVWTVGGFHFIGWDTSWLTHFQVRVFYNDCKMEIANYPSHNISDRKISYQGLSQIKKF